MEGYDPVQSFDAATAARYDELCVRGDEAETVAFLAARAGGGPVLELAVGTGRIALPLAATGVRVDGVDLSEAMVAVLRGKPGGADLDVVLGDFGEVPVTGTYPLVYVVFNTLFNLLTQDQQVRCFENVAAHLDPGGAFVVEAFVPSFLHRLREQQYVQLEDVAIDEVRLDVARHDPVAQLLEESHVMLSERGVELNPIVTRYAWPVELDLMGRIAGLELQERWGGWSGEPFTATSERHVSVWRRKM